MTEPEILIKYIGKIPELVEAVNQYREINDKTIKTLAEAMKQHPQAIIPISELMKISQYVGQTQCLLPDTDDLVNAIAKNMEIAIVPIVRDEMRRAFVITEYTVKHEHVHTTLKDLREVVDKKTDKYNTSSDCSRHLAFSICFGMDSSRVSSTIRTVIRLFSMI